MKKFFGILAIAAALTACNNDSTTDATKDSINKTADSLKNMVDSSANAKKDAIDTSAKMQKNAIDTMNKAMDSTGAKKM